MDVKRQTIFDQLFYQAGWGMNQMQAPSVCGRQKSLVVPTINGRQSCLGNIDGKIILGLKVVLKSVQHRYLELFPPLFRG